MNEVMTRLLKKFFGVLLSLAVLSAAVFALWVWGALNYVYSSGERAGYVQKISKRGWVFKTWEGELAMVNLPGAMPEKFFFTVRDEKVVKDIESTIGSRVVLTYEQHKFIPSQIFGETEYFVVRVKAMQDAPAAEPLPVKS